MEKGKMTPEEIEDIFLQGDARYETFASADVAEFFNDNALEIIKEDISNVEADDENKIYGPQKLQKAVAKKLILARNLILIGYERDIGWGRVDVLAQTKDNKFIAVECGPCRLTKVIDYFKWNELEELWLISIYYKDEKLYIIRRGLNWEKKIEEYNHIKMKELEKCRKTIDSLFKINNK